MNQNSGKKMKKFILLLSLYFMCVMTISALPYTITASAGSNGRISPSGSVEAGLFSDKTFTFQPDSGYEINTVLVDGYSVGAPRSYTFINVRANHTISVTFKPKATQTFTITTSAGSYGSISPSGNVIVSHGNSQTFTFTPNTGYEVNQVLVDGVNNATAVSNGSYTFSNVTANHTISVSFKQKQYTIIASTGSNGGISPSGTITVSQGGTQTFTFTPNPGYEINQVLVDGVNNAAAVLSGNYTFSNVTANHTISVSFKQKAAQTYTIATLAGIGISATTGAGTYNSGTTITVGCTVQSDYTFDGWYEGSTKVSGLQSYSFTVTAARTLQARATQKSYTITASAGSYGSISPGGSTSVMHGNNQTFYFYPNTGYEINQVLVDGYVNTSAATNGNYTFTNVTANHTISVSFKQKQYTITASAGSGGGISPSGIRTINHGSSQTFTFTPNSGYEINQVLVDGVNNTFAVSARNYTFSNVTANHTISVSFKQSCISNIVVQVWDDVLSVVNNPANNGGYTFTSYQWQKNGMDIPGEISGNLYVPDPDGDSYYSVLLTTSNGQHLQTCPVSLRNVSGNKISAYPNPTEGKLTIESAGIRAGDIISVYSAAGMLVLQFKAEAKETSIINIASLEKGIYFIQVNDKQVKILKNNK
jgi:uncharacterized repeat protein (TIGR02543 family)